MSVPVLDAWTLATLLVSWSVYLTALAAAGGVWFVLSQPALPAATRRFVGRITLIGAASGVFATSAGVAVQAGYLIDDGWRGMIDPSMLRLAAEGPLGASSALRAGALLLVAGLPFVRGRGVLVPLVGALLVAGSFSLTGHTRGGASSLPVGLLLVLHLAAASFWLGALWPLYRLAGDPESRRRAASVAERFGRQAVAVVALLAIAGAALAWELLGSVQALYGTDYGRTLLVKIALVCTLLGLGAVNKWRLVPALGGDHRASADRAARLLRRSIALEALVVIALLLATAVLTTVTAPLPA